MATVYSGEVSAGGYNRIRIKCDYSGTSATLTIQFRRTSSYTTTWSDSAATLTFNGQTKSAAYSYSGTVGSGWVDLRGSISGYSISTSGGTYNWSFNNNSGGVLGCSGSITIPAQSTPPGTPTCSATASSASLVNVDWSISDLGNPTGSVSLYNGTTSNPTNLLQTKTTTGSWTFGNDQRTANTTYYYKATATNSAGSVSSSVVNATTLPAGISSITGGSLTASSIVLTLVFNSSGSALTTTAQVSSNNVNWNNTSLTNVQGTTQTYGVTGLNANTQYTRYFRVHTTAGNSGVESFTWVTKPADITSATATDIGETTATVAVACGASGIAATTDLQVSSDNTNWTTVASNVQGTTVNVSLTGLTPDTSTTRYFRVHTVYGNSATATVTFTTLKMARLYGSVNDQTKRINKLYGPAPDSITVNSHSLGTEEIITSFNSSDFEAYAIVDYPDIITKDVSGLKFDYDMSGPSITITALFKDGTSEQLYSGTLLLGTVKAMRLGCDGVANLISNPPSSDLTDTVTLDTTVSYATKEITKLYGSVNGQTTLIYRA